MRPEQHDDVRRQMFEAVLLPPDHPLRQGVVEHIAATNGPLEREWLDLVQDDERLRVELARVTPPPPSLRQRLMEIPLQAQPTWHHDRSRWWIVAILAAGVAAGAITLFLALAR